ncbi:MAG: ABC transporter substrate-binding protein [Candidatus Protistobacter heckmanni]|nr:ABC transporter substrate-binding protein [Candidatus Protistobacter heckmanni]
MGSSSVRRRGTHMALRKTILKRASALLFALSAAASIWAVPARAGDLERILAQEQLKVCIWPDYYGISYYNPKTRQLGGLDVDMAAALGRELGVTPRFVDSSFMALVDNLLSGACDIAMHAVGVTAERKTRLRFSQSYLRSDIYGITTKANPHVKTWADIDRPGRVVAVQAGTVMEDVMRAELERAQLLVVKPPATREREVASGRADVFMTDYPYSRRLLDNTDWARLIPPTQVFHTTDYAYAVAPGSTELLARVDALLAAMKKDGRLRQLAKKYGLDPIVVD